MIKATMIADSISEAGVRLSTLSLVYPRFIHAEFMTHRVFSRNASSSRAIPVLKMLRQVWNDPAMPIHWGKNQAGMQAKGELSPFKKAIARGLWKGAAKVACVFAYGMHKLGLHKQVANRILEPWQYIHVLVTATEWDNFYALRLHEDAQPEIFELARVMKVAMLGSQPRLLREGQWHLPYVSEIEEYQYDADLLRQASAARSCRVSYLKHDGERPELADDLKLCERLAGSEPIHASPFEHQATPAGSADEWHGNFRGWVQHRQLLEADLAAKQQQ